MFLTFPDVLRIRGNGCCLSFLVDILSIWSCNIPLFLHIIPFSFSWFRALDKLNEKREKGDEQIISDGKHHVKLK